MLPLLFAIPIVTTLLFGGVDIATWIIVALLWALLVILWGIECWRSGGLIISRSWLQIPIAAAVLVGLIQLLPLGGPVPGLSGPVPTSLSLDPYATRFFVIKLVTYLTFFAACLAFISTEARLRALNWFVIVFGAAMAFYGILQRLATPEGIYGMRQTEGAIPFGPFVNQHHFATFMQMTGGLALAMLLGKEVGKEKRLLLLAGYIVMGVAAVSTSSRGGLLGFVAMSMFVGITTYAFRGSDGSQESTGRRSLLGAAAAGIALILVIFGVVLLIGGNDSLLRGVGVVQADADISTGRMHFWPIALKIFLQHPILGSGFESFGVAFTAHDTWNGAFRVEQAHNEYLQTLSDSGIAGFLCLLGFIVLLFKKGLATIAGSLGGRRQEAIGALAGCLGVLIHSFFDFPLRTPSNAFFFLILCTIATAAVASEPIRSRRRRSPSEPAP